MTNGGIFIIVFYLALVAFLLIMLMKADMNSDKHVRKVTSVNLKGNIATFLKEYWDGHKTIEKAYWGSKRFKELLKMSQGKNKHD